MFLVTSVTTLRERSSGTLERLLAMPMGKLDLLLGYALAFGLVAAVQSGLAGGALRRAAGAGRQRCRCGCSSWSPWPTPCSARVSGLFVSAFARTEFQAVQFMPAVVIPQILLCGLFVPREQTARRCSRRSATLLPLSYAVDAMTLVSAGTAETAGSAPDVAQDLAGHHRVHRALLGLGAATLRRRTA